MAKRKSKNNVVISYIFCTITIFTVIISFLKLGAIGAIIDALIQNVVGVEKYVVYIISMIAALKYVWSNRLFTFSRRLFAFLAVCIGVGLLIPALFNNEVGLAVLSKLPTQLLNIAKPSMEGVFWLFLYGLLSMFFGQIGVIILVILLFLIAIILLFGKSNIQKTYYSTKDNIQHYQEQKKQKKAEEARYIPTYDLRKAKKEDSIFITLTDSSTTHSSTTNYANKQVVVNVVKQEQLRKPKFTQMTIEEANNNRQHEQYDLPELDLLKDGMNNKSEINQRNAERNAQKLIAILNEFQVSASIEAISIGPSVTRFEVKPDSGVRVNRIASLQHDIKMALAAKYLRIEAPIPGKSAVGIEIPNEEKEMVYMKEVIKQIPANKDSKLLFVLGKDLTGNPIYGELDKMPHLLVAGATGSGKSVCVNSIITSILLRSTPEEVRVLLIDPKKVEFTPYKDIPHLVAPIITDATKASRALEVVVAEMDARYDLFSQYGVKNMKAYHELLRKNKDADLPAMPYIMVVIDELADLMMVASKKVEASIQRITQLARAAGIHLIVATQRPSVDVITGVIKSNIPSRIAFAVSSSVDSRTILDESGAEKLLGYGDMLYIPVGEQNPIRVQGVYVSDEEVESIAQHTQQYGEVEYMEVFQNLEEFDKSSYGTNLMSDDLYQEVKHYVVETQKASTSLLQRRFSIGYSRAAKLIDMLEINGVIGPQNGTKPREVYQKIIEE